MSFHQITDPAEILRVMREYLETSRPHEFFASVQLKPGAEWNGRTHGGPMIIEGCRPYAIATNVATREVSILLTNSDSDYLEPIGTVTLDSISCVETL